MMVWIFLGNGGNLHQAWHALRKKPCCTRYKKGDIRQPLEVLRFVIRSVVACGSLMKVIGSDGLDKKSRLATRRILYLVEWHKAVPTLVEAFAKGAEQFHDALLNIPGLRGELTRKEVLILFACSKYPSLRKVGLPYMTFGQGAKNGALAFLGVPMKTGSSKATTRYYHERLKDVIPQIEKRMRKLFPALTPKGLRVTLGDIEPCLCAAFVYTGLVKQLRLSLGKDCCTTLVEDEDAAWEAVSTMKGPAGFYAYTKEGVPEENATHVLVPRIPYKEIRLDEIPPARFLNKRSMFKAWGRGPVSAAKKRRTIAKIK